MEIIQLMSNASHIPRKMILATSNE